MQISFLGRRVLVCKPGFFPIATLTLFLASLLGSTTLNAKATDKPSARNTRSPASIGQGFGSKNPLEPTSVNQFVVSTCAPPSVSTYSDYAAAICVHRAAYFYNKFSNPELRNTPQEARVLLGYINSVTDGIQTLVKNFDKQSATWITAKFDANNELFVPTELFKAIFIMQSNKRLQSLLSQNLMGIIEPLLDKIYANYSVCLHEGTQRFTNPNSPCVHAGGPSWLAGAYPNIDIRAALVMLYGARLVPQKAQQYMSIYNQLVEGLESQQFPVTGGFHYIGKSNEAPHYQTWDIELLYDIFVANPGDERVKLLLTKSANYFPTVQTNNGNWESWGAPWEKQYWDGPSIPALAIAAAFAPEGNGQNQTLLATVLNSVFNNDSMVANTMEYANVWPMVNMNAASPLQYGHIDDLGGLHAHLPMGESGWNYGFAPSLTPFSSIIGGVVDSGDGSAPAPYTHGIFRGATVNIVSNNVSYFLSDYAVNSRSGFLRKIGDNKSYTNIETAITPDSLSTEPQGAICAKYQLAQGADANGDANSNYYMLSPDMAKPLYTWDVDQLWYASSSGISGLIDLTVREVNSDSVSLSLLFGPERLEKQDPAGLSWTSGDLAIHLYPIKGEIGFSVNSQVIAFGGSPNWNGLNLTMTGSGSHMTAGQRAAIGLWVGPRGVPAPDSFYASTGSADHFRYFITSGGGSSPVAVISNPYLSEPSIDLTPLITINGGLKRSWNMTQSTRQFKNAKSILNIPGISTSNSNTVKFPDASCQILY